MKSRVGLIIVALVLLVGAFAVGMFFSGIEPNFEVVDQAYVKSHVGAAGFILVDTREEDVYNGASPGDGIPGGHIPGAINFPGSELKVLGAAASLAKAGLIKGATLILYCTAGRVSQQFGEALVKDFNFRDRMIKHYKGGIVDWAKNPFNRIDPEGHETGAPGKANPAAK